MLQVSRSYTLFKKKMTETSLKSVSHPHAIHKQFKNDYPIVQISPKKALHYLE